VICDPVETIGGSLHVETLRHAGGKGGRITGLDSYYTADEALKAVGLEA
jgi:hypothetical protein